MANPKMMVEISADSSRLIAAMDRASNNLNAFDAKLTKFGSNVATAVGAVAVGAMVALTKKSLSAGQELENLTRIAGAGVIEFQRYAAASRTLGIDQDKLSDIFKDTNDKLGDFLQNGAGPLKDFFTNIAPQIGVTADQFRNLSGPQALELYYKSLEKANLGQADMTFYMEAIASDASALIPLFQKNNELLKEQGDAIAWLLDSRDLENLSAANTAIDNLTESVVNLGVSFVADLAPYITQAATALLDFITPAETTIQKIERLQTEIESTSGGGGRMGRSKKLRLAALEEEQAAIEAADARKAEEAASMMGPRKSLSLTSADREKEKEQEALNAKIAASQKWLEELNVSLLAEEERIQYGYQKKQEMLKEHLAITGADEATSAAMIEALRANQQAQDDARKAKEQEELATKIEDSQKWLDSFTSSLLSEEEQLQQSYERKQEMLKEHLAITGADEATAKEALEALEADHIEKMLKQEAWYKNQSLKFEQLTNKQKYSVIKTSWSAIEAGLGQHSTALHSINKAFSITDAILKAKESVVSSFAAGAKIGGPPLGFAFAGIAAAAQAANIAAMYSDSPSTGSGGAGAASVSSAADNITPISEQPVEEKTTRKSVTIQIEGDAELLPRETVRSIAEQINDLSESNVRIAV